MCEKKEPMALPDKLIAAAAIAACVALWIYLLNAIINWLANGTLN